MNTEHTEHGWTTTPITADLVRGALELEPTAYGVLPHRLPLGPGADPRRRSSRWRSRSRPAYGSPSVPRPPSSSWTRCPPRWRTSVRRRAPDGVYDLVVDGGSPQQGSVAGGDVLTIDMVYRVVGTDAGSVGHGAVRRTCRPGPRTSRSGCRTTRSPSWSRSAPTHRSSRAGSRAAGSGCTTAARSATASNAASPTATWPAVAAALGGRRPDQPRVRRQRPARPVRRRGRSATPRPT